MSDFVDETLKGRKNYLRTRVVNHPRGGQLTLDCYATGLDRMVRAVVRDTDIEGAGHNLDAACQEAWIKYAMYGEF